MLAAVILGNQGARADDWSERRDDPLIIFAQRWDGNHDGIYTCGEWKRFMRGLFLKADRDHDGTLEALEFRAISGADPIFSETTLAYFDRDGDAKLGLEDLVDRESPFFLRYDTDHDCRVTMREIINGGPTRR